MGSWCRGLTPVERLAVERPSTVWPLFFSFGPCSPRFTPGVCAGVSGFTSGLPTLSVTPPPFVEELVDLRPNLVPATEAAPVRADQPDELVAAVDGQDPVLAPAARAVDEQRFDVGLKLLEHGIDRDEVVPCVEVE